LRTQEFTDAAMLLDLRIERRFGSSVKAACTTSTPAPNKGCVKETTTSADGSMDVVAIVNEGNQTIPEDVGGSVQDNLAATVHNLVDIVAQEENDISDRVIISTQEVGTGTSFSEAQNTTDLATEPEDADVGSNGEDFAPLERVSSRRPSPPCV
jgi:hypothetical protein